MKNILLLLILLTGTMYSTPEYKFSGNLSDIGANKNLFIIKANYDNNQGSHYTSQYIEKHLVVYISNLFITNIAGSITTSSTDPSSWAKTISTNYKTTIHGYNNFLNYMNAIPLSSSNSNFNGDRVIINKSNILYNFQLTYNSGKMFLSYKFKHDMKLDIKTQIILSQNYSIYILTNLSDYIKTENNSFNKKIINVNHPSYFCNQAILIFSYNDPTAWYDPLPGILIIKNINQTLSDICNDIGYTFYTQKSYYTAIDFFKKSTELYEQQDYALYNLACSYSLLNDKKNAILYLYKYLAVSKNKLQNRILTDNDFIKMKYDPEFIHFITEITN